MRSPDWTNARREIPLGWPPVECMPLRGDLLARGFRARDDEVVPRGYFHTLRDCRCQGLMNRLMKRG